MCGTDIPVPECQLIIHQPSIKEISLIGERNFFIGAQTLCVSKNKLISEDKTGLENTTNFQIFMTMMSEKETRDKKEAVIQLFSVILPSYKVIFTPQSMIFNTPSFEGDLIVDENNFEALQQVLSDIFCFTSGLGETEFNPADEKAKEIAEKIMRGRQRIAAQKQEDGSMLVQYTSILTIAINSMSLKDCIDLTLFQLHDLVQRYTLYINWDLDIRTRLAGGNPEGQTENWMKNIH